jgi:hypothetical protein
MKGQKKEKELRIQSSIMFFLLWKKLSNRQQMQSEKVNKVEFSMMME